MAVRSGSGANGLPVWVFSVIGFVLVVGLFFGIRGVASHDGGARGGGGSSSGGTSSGTTTGGGGSDDITGGGSGDSGGGDTSGGKTSGSTDGSWQTGGGDGDGDGGKGRGGNSGGGGGGGGGTPPGWLPWGPKSPNTDDAPEPDSMYDLLQQGDCRLPYDSATDPGQRRDDSGTPQAWKVIEGLAGICKAAHGEPNGLSIATRAEAGLRAAGYRPGATEYLCKDGDAFAVLQRFVAYYRRHPGQQVVLRSSASGAAACANTIAATDTSYAPDATVGLQGTWPDAPRAVELRAAGMPNPLVLKPFGEAREQCCKDAALAVDLPGPDGFGGRRPTSIDVTVVTRSGARVSKQAAFTLDWSGVPQPPGPSVSSRSPSPPEPSDSLTQ